MDTTLCVTLWLIAAGVCAFFAIRFYRANRSSGTAALWFDVERSADRVTVRPKWWQLVNNVLFNLFAAGMFGGWGFAGLWGFFDNSSVEKEPLPRAMQAGMQLLLGFGCGIPAVLCGLRLVGTIWQGRTPTVLDRKRGLICEGRQPVCAIAEISRLEIRPEHHADGGEFYEIGYVLAEDSGKAFHHLFDGGYARLGDVQAFAEELGKFLGLPVTTRES